MSDIFDESDIKPMEGLGDFHLRSAITRIDMESLKRGKGRFREQNSFNMLKIVLGNLKEGDISAFTGRIFRGVGYNTIQGKLVGMSLAQRTLKAERNLYGELFGANCNLSKLSTCDPPVTNYEIMANFYQLSLITANAMSSGRDQHDLLNQYGRMISGIPVLTDILGNEYYLAGDLIAIREPTLFTRLYTLDMLRMLTDKCTERNNVVTGAFLGNLILSDVYFSHLSILDFWKRTDYLLEKYENNCFKIFKAFEALCWGCLLRRDTEELWDREVFLNSTIEGLIDDISKEDIDTLVNAIEDVCITPHHFAQLTGMFRLWGHPVVDPLAGLEKVKKVGSGEKMINSEIVKISGRKIKEVFFTNYHRKHSSYPEYHSDSENYLNDILSQNRPLNLKDPNYNLCWWDNISCRKVFDAPDTFNLSLIVADTAISPTRSEIKKSKSGKEILSPYVRRGVLKFIRDGVINCKELLEGINNHGVGLPSEYRIIGEYPKERELNPTPRMFALMTLIMRSYIVVTESMLSDILDYFPGVTMVDDLLTLSKKMIANTREHQFRRPGSEWFVINIDFEKWNLNMRRQATVEVFKMLGDIYGLPTIYEKTYDIFENSIIYLADGSYLPNLTDSLELRGDDQRSYIGHLGGFEGLRQKGWTIFTMSLIAYVCDKEGVNFRLMGQGDNQVLMIEVFSREEQLTGIRTEGTKNIIKSQVSKILKELVSTFEGVGLPMKPLETWVSSSLFLYGKVPIFKGVPLSMSLKRISRIFPFSNEDLMTLDNALSAISANAQSSSFYDVSPSVSYLCARWQQAKCIKLFLSYHPLSGQKPFHDRSKPNWFVRTIAGARKNFSLQNACDMDHLALGLLYGFKSLGGSNGLSIFHLVLRGFPDPQSRDMEFLISVYRTTDDIEVKQMLLKWMRVKLSPDNSRSMLVEDPVALNLLVPPQTLSITRKIIRANLKNAPTTSQFGAWFKELLEIPGEEGRSKLIDSLLKGDVLYPRLSHDIYSSTLYGYSDSILSKVDKTVTLSRISLRESRVDVVGILLKGELKYLNYLWWKMSDNSDSDVPPIRIASLYVQSIRDIGWGCRVDGVTVPFPSQLVSRKLCNIFRSHPVTQEVNFVSVTVSEQVKDNTSNLISSIGLSPPYLGSSTKEKLFSKHERALFGTEPLLKRPVSLARLINWVIPEGSNYHLLIKDLIRAVTNADPDSS